MCKLFLIYCLRYKMSGNVEKNILLEPNVQIACFVKATIQNPKIFHLQLFKSNPHIWTTEDRFFLMKNLPINFLSIDSIKSFSTVRLNKMSSSIQFFTNKLMFSYIAHTGSLVLDWNW